MPPGIQQQIKIQTPRGGFLGLDTASDPTSVSLARSRKLFNAYQGKLGALTKRPGSIPVINTALPSPIKHLTIYPFGEDQLLASSGNTLYKYESDTLTPIPMTDNLFSSDIYTADYTGINAGNLVNVKVIADGGDLKEYKGTEVKRVTPAPDDPSPLPANVLSLINEKVIKFVWSHSHYVFVNCGDNQIFYSKRAGQLGMDDKYDYFPESHYFIIPGRGDRVNGCGVPFDEVCFVPMRRGWNVISGTNFEDFDSSFNLNTIDGVIAPRSIQVITYANGQQTIAYLSDTGIHEIFTTVLDNRGKQYATRSLTDNKIDFEAFGFTELEKASAISKYIVSLNMYLLEIPRDGFPYVIGYDTRNSEFYFWTGLQINSFIEKDGKVYFAGDDGLLKQFDKNLYSDWTDKDKTTGNPVDFDRLSGMIAFEESGFPSMLDYYILKLKQYSIVASLDISIVYSRTLVEVQEAIRNYYLTWDIGIWDEAAWANLEYSDLVAQPQRLSTKLKLPKQAYYFQIRWRNNRDEPVEVYSESLIGRASGEL